MIENAMQDGTPLRMNQFVFNSKSSFIPPFSTSIVNQLK